MGGFFRGSFQQRLFSGGKKEEGVEKFDRLYQELPLLPVHILAVSTEFTFITSARDIQCLINGMWTGCFCWFAN